MSDRLGGLDPDADPELAGLFAAERARGAAAPAWTDAVWARLEAATLAPLGPPSDDGGPLADGTSAPPDPEPEAGDEALDGDRGPAADAVVDAAADAAHATGALSGGFVLAGSKALVALAITFVTGGLVGGVVGANLFATRAVTIEHLTSSGDASAPPTASTASTVNGDRREAASASALGPSGASSIAMSRAASSSAASSGAASSGARSSAALPGTPSASAEPLTAPAPSDELRAERSVLDEARSALARGQGKTCIAALARHQTQFPKGRLAEERDVLLIQALAMSGRMDEAKERADAFRAARPNSMLAPAVDTIVSGAPK